MSGMKKTIAAITLPLVSAASMAQITWQGEWVEGAMLIGNTHPEAQVQFKGEPVMVAPDGTFVLGLHRDEDPEVSLELMLPGGEKQTWVQSVEQRDYRIQYVEGIAQNIMEPSAEDQDRIWRDVLATREAKALRDGRLDFLADFDWPLFGRISGVYGSQRVYNGEPGTPHYGIDIAAPTGTPFYAPAPGVVTLAIPDMFYSGGTVILDHGHGVSSSFLHMSEIDVAVGDVLQQGDLIGEVGATGRVTGPHLDWRMNWQDSRIDPELLLRASGNWEKNQP
jgi:murein DD-endopeptidase MepM/ murein hydrolase activator NlpD